MNVINDFIVVNTIMQPMPAINNEQDPNVELLNNIEIPKYISSADKNILIVVMLNLNVYFVIKEIPRTIKVMPINVLRA